MIILTYVDETIRLFWSQIKAIVAPAQVKVNIDEISDLVNEEITALSYLPISHTVLLEQYAKMCDCMYAPPYVISNWPIMLLSTKEIHQITDLIKYFSKIDLIRILIL